MEEMNWGLIVVVALVALAVGAALAWYFLRRRTSDRLKRQFGPEYDRAVATSGDRAAAESELREREQRVKRLDIRPLPAERRRHYAKLWRTVQSDFVDKPEASVAAADQLVEEVMEARGYPMADFEERAADVSVDHPHVVENYRQAHALALRAERGDATTEDLRQAMVHYRALFEDLIDEDVSDGLPRKERLAEAKR